MSALFHPYLCGRIAAEWLIKMKKHYIALILTIIMAFLTLSGCNKPNISPDSSNHDASLESKADQTSSLSTEKITYVTCDWPYYNTPQSLYEAATDIFEGKVSNIFFKIIDMQSGKVVDDEKVDDKTYLRLYTVYEIDVTDSYKKAESSKMYVCVSTGFEGYKEAEQRDLMISAEIYNKNTGIQVIREFEHLKIGESCLFLTVDLGGTYNYIVNADQFAFEENGDKKSEAFGYSEIKTFVANQNQDVVDKKSNVNNNDTN